MSEAIQKLDEAIEEAAAEVDATGETLETLVQRVERLVIIQKAWQQPASGAVQ